MFMKFIHPFLTKKVTRHIFTKQRVPRHLIIFWSSADINADSDKTICYCNTSSSRLLYCEADLFIILNCRLGCQHFLWNGTRIVLSSVQTLSEHVRAEGELTNYMNTKFLTTFLGSTEGHFPFKKTLKM